MILTVLDLEDQIRVPKISNASKRGERELSNQINKHPRSCQISIEEISWEWKSKIVKERKKKRELEHPTTVTCARFACSFSLNSSEFTTHYPIVELLHVTKSHLNFRQKNDFPRKSTNTRIWLFLVRSISRDWTALQFRWIRNFFFNCYLTCSSRCFSPYHKLVMCNSTTSICESFSD